MYGIKMDPNFHVISATFNHKFAKFSQINKLLQSPACWIQNMPWKIFIEPVIRDNNKYLSVFVSCTAPATNSRWSCRASVRMYKLDGTRPKIIRTTMFLVFDSAASTSWGHDTFILWDDVLNPVNGFIRNDEITIEVQIDAEIPSGISLTDTYFTDERATTAVKLCNRTISNLQSKIQELTIQTKQLHDTNKNYSEEIENLKNLLGVSVKKSADFEKKFNDEHNSKTELQKSFDDGNKQLEQVIGNNGNLTKTVDAKNTEIDLLTKKIQEFETTQEEVANCRQQKDDVQKKYTSLLNEFENYQRVITNTGNEGENVLKSEIDTMKNDNVQLKKQLSLVQSELNVANDKLTQVDILRKNVQELTEEKAEMQKTADSISAELSETESIVGRIKKELNDEQDDNRKESDNCRSQIQSLKSQLYELLVKLQISQDMNSDIQQIQIEKNKLIEQMKIGYAKYNELKTERISLNSQIDHLNSQISDANENIKNFKTEVESEQREHQECKDQLTISNGRITDLKKTNENLTKTLNDANLKISSFNNSNSTNLTNSLNENSVLKNQNSSLVSQLKSVENELEALRDNNLADQVSRLTADKTDLETKLTSVNKELQETKVQLIDAQKDVDKMTLFERNLSSLQSQFDATQAELKKLQDKNFDEVVSKLNEEKHSLQGLLSSLKHELEETKAILTSTQSETMQVKSLEDENVKLKEQISSLRNMLEQTNSRLQTLNDPKNQTVSIGSKNNGNKEPIKILKVGKTPRSSGQEEVEDLAEIPTKGSLEIRLETMKNQVEKQMKDADNAMEVERRTLLMKIDDLLHHLGEEKQKQEYSVVYVKDLKDEICRLKEETNGLRKLKGEFITKLNTAQAICADTFKMLIDILKNLKTSGKLSCNVEIVIISYFKTIKKTMPFWSTDDMIQSINNTQNQQFNTEISTDVLQTKLDQLQANYEESLNIIKKNCDQERIENDRLRMANNELVVVIENEMNITKQYKEMLKIANSRLENFRKQFIELDNKLLDEKSRRYECEQTNKNSRLFSERIEIMLKDLKVKILRDSVKSAMEESNLQGINAVESGDSNDFVKYPTCIQMETSPPYIKKSSELPAKMMSNPIQVEETHSIHSTANAQDAQSPTGDHGLENLAQDNGYNGKDVSSSNN